MDSLSGVLFRDYVDKKEQGIVEGPGEYFSLLIEKIPGTEYPSARAGYIAKLSMLAETAHFLLWRETEDVQRKL